MLHKPCIGRFCAVLFLFDPLVGTEELGHLEMVGTLVHQLTRNLQFPPGYPWSASTMQVTGDVIADLTEDMAAEQKARLTYDNILRLSDDPDVNDVIRFLREREIVHFQRFGEPQQTAANGLGPSYIPAYPDFTL